MADKTGRDVVLAWLNDAHGMETGLVEVLEHQVKDAADFPQVQARLQLHLEETRRHAEIVKGCIERLGGDVSSLKTGMSSVFGKVQALSTRRWPTGSSPRSRYSRSRSSARWRAPASRNPRSPARAAGPSLWTGRSFASSSRLGCDGGRRSREDRERGLRGDSFSAERTPRRYQPQSCAPGVHRQREHRQAVRKRHLGAAVELGGKRDAIGAVHHGRGADGSRLGLDINGERTA